MEPMMECGTLLPVPIRSVWQGEATDFTPWLAQNLDVLMEPLGLELQLLEMEASAGDFSADIVAQDISSNAKIVIENQFGSTDHRHLGQIITYASSLGAGTVIWIAETIRPEHKGAIDFLNQNLKETLRLFALEVKLFKVDDSKPVYQFQVVCSPTPKEAGVIKDTPEMSEQRARYRTFFQALIDELRIKHQFTKARAGQAQSWYTFASENSKVYRYSASFAAGERIRTEVYIDWEDKAKNELIFDALFNNKEEIEREFGAELKWERLENKRACRVARYRDGDIDVDTETLNSIRTWMIEQLLTFKRVFPARFDAALKVVQGQ
jgi:hypothetical protein